MAQIDVEVLLRAKDQASGVLKSFGRNVEQAGHDYVQFGKNAALGAGILLGGIAAVGKAAIDTAAQFEQNRIALEVMLGSSQKAGVLLKELSDFAIKTPFELPGVIAAGKQLLAMGGSASDVLPDLKAIGDVAAGTGAPLERLIINFGQVRLQGKLTGRELRDFAVNGVPLIDELAKNLGVAKDQIMGMVEAGSIGFDEVDKAFQTMTSSGGKFADLMEKQSHTFGGVMSNIRDQIGRTLAQIAGIDIEAGGTIREGSLFAVMKQGAEALLEALNVVTPKIVAFFDWMSQNQYAVAAIAGAIGGLLVAAVVGLIIVLGPLILAALAFAAAGAAIALAVAWVITHFNQWKQTLIDVYNGVVGFVTAIPQMIIDAFTAVITFLAELPGKIKEFVIDLFVEKIPYAVGFLIGYLGTAIPQMIMTVINGMASLPGLAQAIWNKFKDQIIFIVGFTAGWLWGEISSWPGKIMGFLSSIPGIVADIFERAKQWVFDKMAELFAGVKGWWDKIKGIFDAIIGAAQNAIDKVREGLSAGSRIGRQGGGVVPGPIDTPQLVLAHGGEEVVPFGKTGNGGGAGVTLNVSIGMYAGTQIEKRNIARELYEALVQIANAENKSVAEMMGA